MQKVCLFLAQWLLCSFYLPLALPFVNVFAFLKCKSMTLFVFLERLHDSYDLHIEVTPMITQLFFTKYCICRTLYLAFSVSQLSSFSPHPMAQLNCFHVIALIQMQSQDPDPALLNTTPHCPNLFCDSERPCLMWPKLISLASLSLSPLPSLNSPCSATLSDLHPCCFLQCISCLCCSLLTQPLHPSRIHLDITFPCSSLHHSPNKWGGMSLHEPTFIVTPVCLSSPLGFNFLEGGYVLLTTVSSVRVALDTDQILKDNTSINE